MKYTNARVRPDEPIDRQRSTFRSAAPCNTQDKSPEFAGPAIPTEHNEVLHNVVGRNTLMVVIRRAR